MANQIKYLSLEGLARVVAQIRAKFGTKLSYSPSTTNGTISLLDDVIDKNTSTYGVLSTITIPSASTSQAGLMTTAQVTELNRLTAEEITEIKAGNGLTGGDTKGSITLNVGAGTGISVAADAVNLKTASTSEIGGIKIAAKRTTTPTLTTGGTTTGRYYGVELDNNNKAFVNVPWVNTTTLTINATANDDDVVILSGTSGSNGVTYGASHAKMFDATTPTTTNKYTSGNNTTSISGSGSSGTIKIPQLTVDEYGHVKAATDESVTIKMPTIPSAIKNPEALTIKVGNNPAVSYDGSTATSVVITPATIGIPNVMQYVGQTASTQTLADGSATAAITLTTGSHTANSGDVVIDSSNSREYIWNGSKWELLGVDDISTYKKKQTAVTSPTASSTAIAFIDTISQDTQGVITATKKIVQNATTGQAGVVKIGSNINVSGGVISVPTAAANALGVVKGWHHTSGTATGARTTDATNSPIINRITTINGRYYGVETDSTGAMYVNVPFESNYIAFNVFTNSASTRANAAVEESTNEVYLNLVENSQIRSSHKIKGAGGTTVSTDAKGHLTITSETHVAITNGEIDALFA